MLDREEEWMLSFLAFFIFEKEKKLKWENVIYMKMTHESVHERKINNSDSLMKRVHKSVH